MEARKIFTGILFLLLVLSLGPIRHSTSTMGALQYLLGVAGTALIFGADMFYSSRKYGKIGFGKLKRFLQIHVVIGIAGPLLIALHSGLNFHGFAGFVLALTLIVFASGFFGKYVLRLIPRKIDNPLKELSDLKEEESQARDALFERINHKIDVTPYLGKEKSPLARPGFLLLIKITVRSLTQRLLFGYRLLRLDRDTRRGLGELSSVFYQRSLLERQIQFYYVSKGLLSRWKTMHIPLTVALFVTIITHIMSVFYYGKFY